MIFSPTLHRECDTFPLFNSSCTDSVRDHPLIVNTVTNYKNCTNINGTVSAYEDTEMPEGRQIHSLSASFPTCTFSCLSTTENGGAISFMCWSSLSVKECIFLDCSTSVSLGDESGGGAVHVYTCSTFVLTSSRYFRCTSTCYGGGLFFHQTCVSSTVSSCSFLFCIAEHRRPLITYRGPTSSVSSSRFVYCTGLTSGGGVYHDSRSRTRNVHILDSLFTNYYANVLVANSGMHAGGGFEDYRSNAYTSNYSFSFFTRNTTLNGRDHDVSIIINALPDNSMICSVTSTSFHSFWNKKDEDYEIWLPWTNVLSTVASPRAHHYQMIILSNIFQFFIHWEYEKTSFFFLIIYLLSW